VLERAHVSRSNATTPGRVRAVRYGDAAGAERRVRAERVVLAAGAVENVRCASVRLSRASRRRREP
jgi:hypothetical protein